MEENKTTITETNNDVNAISEGDDISKVDEPKESKLTPEEEMAKMRVEMLKLKKALDKSASDTASYKKQLRERQSADEIALQEKAEKEAAREAEIERLRKENTVSKFEKNFLALGYSEELANKAAIAQYENDTDSLFEYQKAVNANREKLIKEEIMRSMPTSVISNKNVQVTQSEFNKMKYSQRLELKQQDPELFKKLNGYN